MKKTRSESREGERERERDESEVEIVKLCARQGRKKGLKRFELMRGYKWNYMQNYSPNCLFF